MRESGDAVLSLRAVGRLEAERWEPEVCLRMKLETCHKLKLEAESSKLEANPLIPASERPATQINAGHPRIYSCLLKASRGLFQVTTVVSKRPRPA